ncbi:MAG TPA: hypothetical protein DCY13_20200 [Verrucomicrobiales bacterium]|nr:hypothetical protein [Verrucomicrobiales bacterium]
MHDSPSLDPLPHPRASVRGWQLADVIDFEFLLEQDGERPLADLETRDREFVQQAAASEAGLPRDRRRLFRAWLEKRRSTLAGQPLPGAIAVAAWRLLAKAIALSALLLGGLTAYNLLRYDGAQPVNVATYLGWLVLVQMGLATLAFVLLAVRRAGWLSLETSLLAGLVRWSWSRFSLRINRHLLDRIPAGQRQSIAAFLGGSSNFRQLYGGATWWPVVGVLQWFGVCFNVAAIATTIALVVFSDRAFGWQSAVNFSPEQIHQLTRTLAAPWSSLVPAAAAPTLEQIAGSRIILKDGIRQLATENLVAWWPFLIAAVSVYGLLPRLLLWAATLFLSASALARLRFEHIACDRLHERLTAAHLRSQAIAPEPAGDLSGTPATPSQDGGSTSGRSGAPTAAVILVSGELLQQLDREACGGRLEARFRLRAEVWLGWAESQAEQGPIIDQVKADCALSVSGVVVLLEEAWQPPIAEKLAGIRRLREAIGSKRKLLVVLVGRPKAGDLLTPVRPADLRVWQQRLATLADPFLRVESLNQ